MRLCCLALFIATLVTPGVSMSEASDASTLYNIDLSSIEGPPLDLAQLRGKVVVFANIASQCGFTPQLEGLQQLHASYQSQGVTVVGLPSNDYGGQTPESNEKMAEFCQVRYGVSFPLSQKIQVKGPDKHPLAAYLVKNDPAQGGEIRWNFEKFVVGADGQVVKRFRSKADPMASDGVAGTVKNLLQ